MAHDFVNYGMWERRKIPTSGKGGQKWGTLWIHSALSGLGMVRGIRMAAGLLDWGEFHDFDAGSVWVVRIETVFAVAADFGAVECCVGTGFEFGGCGVNVFDAEGEMILHTKLFVVGGGWDVEHVLDPIGAIGNLEFVPVGAVVFKSSCPVKAETKKVDVETVFSSQVFDYETRMDQARADLLRSWFQARVRGTPLNKRDRVSFRVPKAEGLRTIRCVLDFSRLDAVREKVLAKL